MELATAAHPILAAQTADTFPAFTEKIANLIFKVKSDKLAKSIDLGLDAFLSVPKDKVDALESALKAEMGGLKTSDCTLVPLPPASLADKFATAASGSADKLKAFDSLYGGSLKTLQKTDSAVCLPSPESLAKLSLVQVDVGRSFGAAEGKAFGSYTGAMLQSSLGFGDVMPLANDAKKLAPSATAAEKARFQKAGKAIEAASKQEANKARMAAQLEKQAANKAAVAKQSAAASAAQGMSMEEIQQKKLDAQAAQKAKVEQQKADQAAYYAELRAKAEANKAAKAK